MCLNRVIPGNYFITKSMEWTTASYKVYKNGTVSDEIKLEEYWFLKKYLVYYSFFFSKKISMETEEVFEEISKIFDNFIATVDPSKRIEATKFFFDRDIRNLNSITRWNDFYDISRQPTEKNALKRYKEKAKKNYVMYLMGFGGKSDIKKKVLFEWIPQGVKYHDLYTRIEKYIGSVDKKKIEEIIGDVPSTIRNIRQVCFYYGIFFRKDSGRVEEYSLTTVGNLLINAGQQEFAIIMEHQKIRMISQPPNVSISNVKKEKEYEKLFIEINPYHKILKYLIKNKRIDKKSFQYIVSRNIPLNSNLKVNEEYISKFKRNGDKNPEDFIKELKKYIHGLNTLKNIRILYERNKNSKREKVWSVEDITELQKYYDYIYFYKNIKKKLMKNKIKSYKNLILNNYIHGKNIEDYSQMKSWYIYISDIDKSLLFSLLIYNWENSNIFKNILKFLNINKQYVNESLKETNSIHNGEYYYMKYQKKFSEFIDESQQEVHEKFNIHSIENLLKTSNSKFDILESKKRKQIAIIKSFYTKRKVEKCDCCGKETFKLNNGNFYLEYHHLVPLSKEGTDHVLNIFGICPMCHRKFHFSEDKLRKQLYLDLNQNDTLGKIDSEQFSLFNRYKYLYQNGQINLLGLYFLKDEGVFKEQDIDTIITSK